MDHDLKPDDGEVVHKMLPFMYADNRDNPIFTIKNFLLTLLKGIIHCTINFFFVVFSLKDEAFDYEGYLGELWVISVCLFTNILLIVTTDLLIYTKYHTWINFLILGVVTFLAYILFLIVVHNFSFFNSVGTMVLTFKSAKIWFIFILICGTCALIDFTILAFQYSFDRNITKLLQIQYNSSGVINDEEDAPEEVKEKLKIYNKYQEEKNEESENKNENKSRLEDVSKNNLIQTKDNNIFSKNNSEEKTSSKNSSKSSKSNNSERSSFMKNVKKNKERRETSESHSSEKNSVSNGNSEEKSEKNKRRVLRSKNSSKNKDNKKNKKKQSESESSSQKSNSNSNSETNSKKSNSGSNSKKSNKKSKSESESESNSNKNSSGSNGSDDASYNDIDDDFEKDIPKKTMEYMSRNTNNHTLDNGLRNDDVRKKVTSINDNDDDEDIGENYEDDFSENVSREIKYFNPKQSQAPSSSYFTDEKQRVANRFKNFH
jgi:hypothetical protein